MKTKLTKEEIKKLQVKKEAIKNGKVKFNDKLTNADNGNQILK